MAKDRVITGFGPSSVTVSSTGNTGWIRFGPFVGNTFGMRPVFSATSVGGGAVVTQGQLHAGASSGLSTAGAITLIAARNSSQSGTQLKSTSALLVSWVRFRSTELASGETVVCHFSAVA
jgi:hypothetical protein